MQQNQDPGFECSTEREVCQLRVVSQNDLSEIQRDILNKIKLVLEEDQGEQLMSLKHEIENFARNAAQKVNSVLAHI